MAIYGWLVGSLRVLGHAFPVRLAEPGDRKVDGKMSDAMTMKCEVCGRGPVMDCVSIFRVNPTGEVGIWRCWQCMTEEQRKQHQDTADIMKTIRGGMWGRQ